MSSDAAPPSYDSIITEFHKRVSPDSSLSDVKTALLAVHETHKQHISALTATAEPGMPSLTPDQQVKFATSVATTMTSSEGNEILKKMVVAAIEAAKSTDKIFSDLHVKLVEIDGKYTNPTTGAFAPRLVKISEDWKDVALKSKTQASEIAAYAERFATIIMPLIDDKSLTRDDKLNALNTFIKKADSFRQTSDDIIKDYNKVQTSFETLTGDFRNWAKDKRNDLSTTLKDAESQMDDIVKDLAKKTREMIGVGAGAAASLPVTGVAAIFAGPFAPAVIIVGLIAAAALTTTFLVLSTQVSNLQDQKRRKQKEIDDLKKNIKDLDDVKAELIRTGNTDLITLQGNITAMSQVWLQVRNDATTIKAKLTDSKDDIDLRKYFMVDVKLIIQLYETMASYLRSYATGKVEIK